jgi:hypothetical protein
MARHWILPDRFDTYRDDLLHTACGKLAVFREQKIDGRRFTREAGDVTCKDCQRSRDSVLGSTQQQIDCVSLARIPEKGERCTVRFNGNFYPGELVELQGKQAVVRYANRTGMVRERRLPIHASVAHLRQASRAGCAFEGTAPDLSRVIAFAARDPQGFTSALVNLCDTYVESRAIRKRPQAKRESWALHLLEAHDALQQLGAHDNGEVAR